MADLLVKVNEVRQIPGAGWQDGDIIAAISDRRRLARIARVAWRAGNPSGAAVLVRHAQGEYQGGGLHEEIHKTFRRVAVRVVSATEIEETWPGFAPIIVGPTPSYHAALGREAHIQLAEFLRARRASGRLLFRDPDTGEVRWYARENPIPSRADLDALWAKLWQGHGWQGGGHVCPERWPMGKGDCSDHLALYVDDFDEALEQEWRDTPTARRVIRRADDDPPSTERANRSEYEIDWRALPGMSVRHRRRVLDWRTPFDRRHDHNPYSLTCIRGKL